MQPGSENIGDWMLVAGFLLSCAASMMVMLNSRRTQKRSVSMEESYATVPDLNTVKTELKELRDAIVTNGETRRQNIEARVEKVRMELKEDIKGVQTDVQGLSREVSALATNCELTNASVSGLSTQISRMFERGVATQGGMRP